MLMSLSSPGPGQSLCPWRAGLGAWAGLRAGLSSPEPSPCGSRGRKKKEEMQLIAKRKKKKELMICRNGHKARPPQIIKHGQVHESSVKVSIKTLVLKWIYWMIKRSWGAE